MGFFTYNIIMKVFICLSALFAMAQCGPLNQYLASGAAAGPVHPTIGAVAATKRGWRNIALEGFSEDDNQDGFVDPIGPAVVAAPAKVGLGCFLESANGGRLETQIGLEILSDLPNQTLEGKFADEQFSRLLVATNLPQGHGTRAVTMGFLD